jgi:hypothetical protein
MNKQVNTKISITCTVLILLKNNKLKAEAVLGHVMEACMGSRGYTCTSYLALDGGECSGLRHCRFTPGEWFPGAHWIGSCVGPKEGLDVQKKRVVIKPTDLCCIRFFIRMPSCAILKSKNITFGTWKIWGKRVRNKTGLRKMKATKNDNLTHKHGLLNELCNYPYNC